MPILVITERRRLSAALAELLGTGGYAVQVCHSGLAALRALTVTRYDTILLEWNLHPISGLSVLRELRTRGIDAPVLVLGAGATVEERVLALDSGADDFLRMPFHPDELMARVRRMLRSYGHIADAPKPEIYCLADLTVDCDHRLATRSGKRLMLSQKEYAILECLIRHQGQTLSASEIEADIASQTSAGGTIISVYIHYLRRKIDHGFAVKLLHTVRKGGYVLKAEQQTAYAS